MNKTAKAFLIPVAAFAVTVTTASAFNSEVLVKAGLSETEIEAFEEARELRKSGDKEGARDVLIDAGIDLETMQSVREAMHEHRDEMRTAIDEAVEADDFDAFKEAVEGSPLADIITTEADFEQFVEAHQLRKDGEFLEAREIMEELGLELGANGFGGGHMMGNRGGSMYGEGGKFMNGQRDGRFNGFRGGQS